MPEDFNAFLDAELGPNIRAEGEMPHDWPAELQPSVSYEAASMQRRLSPWNPQRLHINSIIAAEGALLTARSRSIIANSPYASNSSETFTTYATGTGIKLSSLVEDPDRKAEIEDLFAAWTDEADADGLTDFYGLQALACRGTFDAGEVFGRMRPRFASDGLTVPLQVQLYEAEQLDLSYTTALGNGNQIRAGIEFDQIGRRVAYHFFKNHPGDATLNFANDRLRVPASRIFHVFKPLRPGQIRGKPWLTSAMLKLYDLDQYDDAELARKKCAAMFMAFAVKQLNPDAAQNFQLAAAGGQAPVPDEAGLADLLMEPNIMQALPQGWDVKFSQPADVGPNYEAFQIRTLYAVCAAMGLPYHAITGDVSKANYSSLRAALIEVKRRIQQFQHETLVFQMCRPIYWSWLDQAVLSGALSLAGYAANKRMWRLCEWRPPTWEWVDPKKDVEAEILAVDNGFKSRDAVIEERGDDPAQVDKKIAAGIERAAKEGLDFKPMRKAPGPAAAGDGAPADGADDNTGDGTSPATSSAQDEGGGFSIEALTAAFNAAMAANRPTPAPPDNRRERTVVTKHDERGRILEFERFKVG